MKKYYVYIIFDPISKGDFIYGNYKFDYEPFYVGKGTYGKGYNRENDHFRNTYLKKNSYKNNKIKKIISSGLYPIIKRIEVDMLEEDAFKLEISLIKEIGRYNINSGPLTNLTDGGEGISGLIKTKEHREKLSISHLGKKLSSDTREKISKSLIGHKRNLGKLHSEETKKKISNSKKGTKVWNSIAILQYTIDGEFIKEWVSSRNAAENLGLSQGNIWSVINGNRKTCGGFVWKVKE